MNLNDIVYRGISSGQGIDHICNMVHRTTGQCLSRHDAIQIAKKVIGLDSEQLPDIHDQLILKGVSFFDSVFAGLYRIEQIRKHDPEVTPDVDGFVSRLFQGPDLESLHNLLSTLKRHKYELISQEQASEMISSVESYIDWLFEAHDSVQGLFEKYLGGGIDLEALEESLNSLFKELEDKWFSELEAGFNL